MLCHPRGESAAAAEFQRVFDAGRRAHGRYLTIIAAPAPGPDSRIGIVASKKLGGAVVRNRAKRLIREMFRTQPRPDRGLRSRRSSRSRQRCKSTSAEVVSDYHDHSEAAEAVKAMTAKLLILLIRAYQVVLSPFCRRRLPVPAFVLRLRDRGDRDARRLARVAPRRRAGCRAVIRSGGPGSIRCPFRRSPRTSNVSNTE